MEVLGVKNLKINLKGDKNKTFLIPGVDLKINSGEIVGIAGESGSGKTITTLSLTKLLPEDVIEVKFDDYRINRVKVDSIQIPYLRGRFISYVFQDPLPSLDPMFTIGYQFKEICNSLNKEYRESEVISILHRVGLTEAERVLKSYPHQLSGGMAQRAAIALALTTGCKVLVADEPTTALDANLRKAILDLLNSIREENSVSIFFISHDLYQIFYLCDYIYIFYAGRILESGPKKVLKNNALHPYTRALLKCLPKREEGRFYHIPGQIPDIKNPPPGCRFYPRCELARDICQEKEPDLIEVKKAHFVRCHLFENGNTQG
jgi:oligopeptide/dipeptide ABC transporter ATP-binding protein